MKIYLMRHAEAELRHPDSARELTPKGNADAYAVARHLLQTAALPVGIRILSSPYARARQTADILAATLGQSQPPECIDGITPCDDAHATCAWLNRQSESFVLVGHNPHLSTCFSLLLANSPTACPIRFKKAAILCLERQYQNAWALRWMLTPSLAHNA